MDVHLIIITDIELRRPYLLIIIMHEVCMKLNSQKYNFLWDEIYCKAFSENTSIAI